MRERKIDTLASNSNYVTGDAAGTPTKIAPPSAQFTDGAVPDRAYGAQWKNYVDHYLQKQIECSAQLPFRNFLEVPDVMAVTTTPQIAFSPVHGFACVANGVDNTVYVYPELGFLGDTYSGGAGPLPITLSPGAGPFTPKCVTRKNNVDNNAFFVGGINAAAPTKTIWQINGDGSTGEVTSAASGAVEHIFHDRVIANVHYGLVADANRSVLRRNGGTGVWDVIGTRGGSATNPSQTNFSTCANGVIVFAYTNGAVISVNYITASPFASASRTVTDTGTILDLQYSPQLGKFMLLTTTKWYVFSDPAQATYEEFDNKDASVTPLTVSGGCLTDTGCVTWGSGNRCGLVARDWPGSAPHMLKFGDFVNGIAGYWARYDGSAIWFMTDSGGVKRLFRSLRSN